jgi:hypothetical protein
VEQIKLGKKWGKEKTIKIKIGLPTEVLALFGQFCIPKTYKAFTVYRK